MTFSGNKYHIMLTCYHDKMITLHDNKYIKRFHALYMIHWVNQRTIYIQIL
jgi:hypothetical protein